MLEALEHERERNNTPEPELHYSVDTTSALMVDTARAK